LNELHQTIKHRDRFPIIQLKYDNEENNAVLKDIQFDPITEEIFHVDFLRIAMDQELTLTVPIQLTGTSEGVKQGGILQFILRKVMVKCLPRNIPEHLEVDISGLNIGDSIELSSVQLPENVEILDELEQPVAIVAAPTITITEEPAEEGEEAVAGEEAEKADESEKDSKDSEKEDKSSD
jgi:large subunit ribosomal protein L25